MDVNTYRQAVSGRVAGRADKVIVGLVLLLALLYRLYGLTGDIMYDPVVYAQSAYNLLGGTFRLDTDCWYTHRLTVFVPVVLAYAALGVGTISTHLWPLLLSLLQIGAILWLGCRWLGRETAVLGALFLALLPLDVVYAGILNPDVVIACFVTCSAVSWIGAFEGRDSPSMALLFLAGLFCGLAVITRPYAVLMVFFFAGYAVWRRTFLRSLLWWCLGMVTVGLPFLLLYAILTGDPLYRLQAISGFYGAPPTPEGSGLLVYPGLIWNIGNPTGLFAPLFAFAAVAALLRPTRQRLVLLCWMAPIFLYLQFGSMSLDSYVPVFKRVRFLTPLLAPAALLAALVILEEVPPIVRRAAGLLRFSDATWVTRLLLIGLILILAASSLVFVRKHRDKHLEVANNFRSAVTALRSEETIPVLFDHWRTAIRFSYYFDFKEGSHLYIGADESQRMKRTSMLEDSRLGYLRWYENPVDLPEAFIVLEDEILAQAARVAASDPGRSTYPAKDIPAYCHTPPASWQLVERFGTSRVFRTSRKDSP